MGTATTRKHQVELTDEQRARLLELTRNGAAPAKNILHARILLLADRHHPDGQRPDDYIATALGVHLNTVKRTRWRFARDGEAPALQRRPRAAPPVPPKIDGRVEAHLVALCCSPAPEGHARWTLSLLADELVSRKLVTTVCVETVRRALKKMSCSPGGSGPGASPSGTGPASSPRWKTSSTCTPPPTPRRSR